MPHRTQKLPERNEGVAVLAANDVNTSVWNTQSLEERTNVTGVRRPRQILQPNYNTHVVFFVSQ